jgi:biopolymer transport protein ExbD
MINDDSSETGHKEQALPAMKRVNRSAARADVESIDIDVTPVMNFFMVIIPFLLSMAVFTQLAVIDFSLPPAITPGAATSDQPVEKKELDISIVITPEGYRIVGTGKQLELEPKVRGKYQYDKLRALLQAVKFQYPSQKSVVLVLDGNVLYDDIIKFMDVCRESQFPDIGLSGEIG